MVEDQLWTRVLNRIMFPATFMTLNVMYWSYYLTRKIPPLWCTGRTISQERFHFSDLLVVLSHKEDSISLMYWSYYLTRKIPPFWFTGRTISLGKIPPLWCTGRTISLGKISSLWCTGRTISQGRIHLSDVLFVLSH